MKMHTEALKISPKIVIHILNEFLGNKCYFTQKGGITPLCTKACCIIIKQRKHGNNLYVHNITIL